MTEQTLDERIDQAASDNAAFDKFMDIDWGSLSDRDYSIKREQVFRQMRAQAKLRSVAGDVRGIDADLQRRQADESGDDG